MGTIATINIFIYTIICFICIFIGLDLKKLFSWLLGFYGFFSGAIIGLLSPHKTMDIQLGGILAFIILYGSAMARWHRQRYTKGAAEVWLARYGQDKRISSISSFLKKMINK